MEPTGQVCSGPACRGTASIPVPAPWSLGAGPSVGAQFTKPRAGCEGGVSFTAESLVGETGSDAAPGGPLSSLVSALPIQRPSFLDASAPPCGTSLPCVCALLLAGRRGPTLRDDSQILKKDLAQGRCAGREDCIAQP